MPQMLAAGSWSPPSEPLAFTNTWLAVPTCACRLCVKETFHLLQVPVENRQYLKILRASGCLLRFDDVLEVSDHHDGSLHVDAVRPRRELFIPSLEGAREEGEIELSLRHR